MTVTRIALSACLVVVAGAAVASRHAASAQGEPKVLHFVAVVEPHAGAKTTNTWWQRAIQGLPAQPGEVEVDGPPPNISQANFPASYEGDGCSGTLVGPVVFLTAAHCFESNAQNGKRQYVTVTKDTKTYQGQCEAFLDGAPDTRTRDIAWCLLEHSPGNKFDTVADVTDVVKANDLLILTGFAGGSTFTAGASSVSNVFPTRVQTNGPAWLQSGDSGGGMYKHFKTGTTTVRRLVAVNSFVDQVNKVSEGLLVSTERIALINWRSKQQGSPQICGVDHIPGCL